MNDFILHYGIKGQQWGVRRFQDEDGTLTEEGKRRYGYGDLNDRSLNSQDLKRMYSVHKSSDQQILNTLQNEKKRGAKISKRRIELAKKYQEKGFTKEQAEIQAYRRSKIENVLKIAGAVALVTALAYGAYKGHNWLVRNADKTIKKGSELFRVSGSSGGMKDRAGYVATNAKDADKYIGHYGKQIKAIKPFKKMELASSGKDISGFDEGIYQTTAKASKRIRVAGDRKAKKVYKQLLKNDPGFYADNEAVKKQWAVGMLGNSGDSYTEFNTRLAGHASQEEARVQKKFYDALRKKGYGGVIDVNDRDVSGYMARKPVILFNMKNSVGDQSIRKLSDIEMSKKADWASSHIWKQRNMQKAMAKTMKRVRNSSLRTAGLASMLGIATLGSETYVQNRASAYRDMINAYRKEHPNTKLTDDQILKNELGNS